MSKSTEDRIGRTPGVCGGKACITGHRVRVLDIVGWHEHQGMTPDEIVSHFPTITLAAVHAALAYYFDHIEEIQQEMRTEPIRRGSRRQLLHLGRGHPRPADGVVAAGPYARPGVLGWRACTGGSR